MFCTYSRLSIHLLPSKDVRQWPRIPKQGELGQSKSYEGERQNLKFWRFDGTLKSFSLK